MATEVVKRTARQQMDIVTVGHVDHGKSTVIGRLLADTGSLPEGKLEQVKEDCRKNARPFEYAFLLDALKAEQSQGITIDAARCFFHTEKRNYILHDAPGHIEFLKNMITGAARAEAALVVIDAQEGIRENSKRHGYMLSMLGIKQIAVVINKLDLMGFSETVYNQLKTEYTAFLDKLGVKVSAFIPVSARDGVNITALSSSETPWYTGHTVLGQIESFEKVQGREQGLFRMPVQDIYKFTASGDARRIVSGTIESGSIKVGTPVVFFPSGKESRVKTIEIFNAPTPEEAQAGFASGFTLDTQIYIKAGELMCKKDELQPHIGRRFRANIFWMGRPPFINNKEYKLKIGASAVPAFLTEIVSVLDASDSELGTLDTKSQVERHDVAEVIIETSRPIAYDLRNNCEPTGRFVIVDEYEISGAGIVLEPLDESDSVLMDQMRAREEQWEKGNVSAADRAKTRNHTGKSIVINGIYGCGKRRLARALEEKLFAMGCASYYFGISNLTENLDRNIRTHSIEREHALDKLGDLAHIMADAGLLFITTVTDVDDYDMEHLLRMAGPDALYAINMGDSAYTNFQVDQEFEYRPDNDVAADAIIARLREIGIIKA